MVAGSLFLNIQLANASGNVPHSATGSTYVTYDASGRPFEGMANWIKMLSGRLSSEDKDLHIRTVIMVLNNADNGDVGEWFSRSSPDRGLVRVVYTYEVGNGYCRVFQSQIVANGDTRQYQETACMQMGSRSWSFYNK